MRETIVYSSHRLAIFNCMIRKPVTHWQQFRHCKAWIGSIGSHLSLVKSYNTIVANIAWETSKLYYSKKYSVTTSKQLTEIAKEYNLEVIRILEDKR